MYLENIMINRASIKLKKLPLLLINQSTNTDSIFCTYTKYKAIRATPKKKLIMTNPLIRAKTSMTISMKDKSVKKIKEFKPLESKQLQGKVIVDIIFNDDSKVNSIELVEMAIEDIEKGKIFVNE